MQQSEAESELETKKEESIRDWKSNLIRDGLGPFF